MTDKEKASELALKLEGEIGTSPHSRLAIEEAFLEMAAWKDKEMQETIEVAEDHAFFAGSYREREKFEDEKKELRGLVKMLPVNATNQTIIEDLTELLS